MRVVNFKQVDVFTDKPFMGNPLAVVLDAEGLSDTQMQHIARWTNLSETTFVLPPTQTGADYRLRIFSTARELPFAGHPSVGSAHALREAGLLPGKQSSWVMECAAGLQPMRIGVVEGADDPALFVGVPRAQLGQTNQQLDQQLTGALRIKDGTVQQARTVNLGPVWLIADLGDAASVLALNPDASDLLQLSQNHSATGVTVFGRCDSPDTFCVVRSFCPGEGMFEDPVCGSGNAAVAAYRRARGDFGNNAAHYRASQGQALGRKGRVDVQISADGLIEIGGTSVTAIDGRIRLT